MKASPYPICPTHDHDQMSDAMLLKQEELVASSAQDTIQAQFPS